MPLQILPLEIISGLNNLVSSLTDHLPSSCFFRLRPMPSPVHFEAFWCTAGCSNLVPYILGPSGVRQGCQIFSRTFWAPLVYGRGSSRSIGRGAAPAVRLRFAHPTTALRLWSPRSRGRGRPRAPAVPAPPALLEYRKGPSGVRQGVQTSSRTFLGPLVYGRRLNPRPVQNKAFWCTAEGGGPICRREGAG